MIETKQQFNKIKNIDIDNNLGDFYALLANLIINLDSPHNSLHSYLNYLMTNEALQIMISAVFDSAAAITVNSSKDYNSYESRYLPDEYTKEPWRSRKLITCIFETQPRTIQSLQEIVRFWQNENAMYI